MSSFLADLQGNHLHNYYLHNFCTFKMAAKMFDDRSMLLIFLDFLKHFEKNFNSNANKSLLDVIGTK